MFGTGLKVFLPRAACAALAGLCLVVSVGSWSAPALAWSEFGTVEKEKVEVGDGPEIREPFFAFLLGMAAADSLGHWSGEDLRAHALSLGAESRFPLDEVVTLSRSRVDQAGRDRYEGAQVQAVWRIVLTEAQDRPMPYSMLGYHPGSLRIGGEMVLSEFAPVDMSLRFTVDDEPRRETVTDVRVFAMEKGYILLDADGWLDALLGSALDDAWTLGFVIGREQGRLMGLGVSLGRDGRQIYGEFDFATDEILTHGRPLVNALSQTSRSWLNVENGHLPTPWIEP